MQRRIRLNNEIQVAVRRTEGTGNENDHHPEYCSFQSRNDSKRAEIEAYEMEIKIANETIIDRMEKIQQLLQEIESSKFLESQIVNAENLVTRMRAALNNDENAFKQISDVVVSLAPELAKLPTKIDKGKIRCIIADAIQNAVTGIQIVSVVGGNENVCKLMHRETRKPVVPQDAPGIIVDVITMSSDGNQTVCKQMRRGTAKKMVPHDKPGKILDDITLSSDEETAMGSADNPVNSTEFPVGNDSACVEGSEVNDNDEPNLGSSNTPDTKKSDESTKVRTDPIASQFGKQAIRKMRMAQQVDQENA